MCGFVGLIRRHMPFEQLGFPEDLLQRLKRAGETLKNRGPDQSGIWSDERCALIHRRLHVIGSSDDGRQPLQDKAQRYTMVYNGAIYNFKDLAKTLPQLSISENSCDTETVLEGFVQHSRAWFQRLNGMFAIGIWDQKENELWLARDRFGQKPLYYGWVKSGFIFGSELKALLPLLKTRPKANHQAIHHYLSYGYIPSPMTGFEGLKKLEAGTFLRLKLKPGADPDPDIIIEPYLPQLLEKTARASTEDLQAELFEKLELAVKRCLISSKPLGTFLSGGVDSSAVTAMTTRLSSQKTKTFSVGFEDPNFDERPQALRVARHLETDHHDIVFEDKNIIPSLEILSNIYDEPFGDSSAIPMMALAQFTREQVTVALSGDGADELFMGYPRHLEMARQQKLSNLPGAVFKFSKALNKVSRSKRLNNLTRKGSANSAELYFLMVSHFGPLDKSSHYTHMMKAHNLGSSSDILNTCFEGAPNFVEGALMADQRHYLSEDILTKSDRAAMAMSLEVRTPFLDIDLVDFAHRLPWQLKSYDGRLKALLKDSVSSLLLLETLNRPKQGFSVPLQRWLSGPLKDYVRDILLDKNAFVLTLLNRSYVEQILKSSMAQSASHYHHIWSLLILELWAKKWVTP